ncbi:replicative DNA helicase [Geodermatophilus obscurus]|uniref:Replicative DNA helicase n=1 Tax=Geodermatophilus obscurus TaxID=1861 RepID=A0A1M7UWJ7_9ACTN|nr:replicative DNA helicase [Geodermatophilus obscurus]SHN87339.1 replicative DNA helicase [Geodermatophilus obscurus]
MAVADDFSRPTPTAPQYDRQPPQDVAAEQSVLGGMLLSKDAIADVVEVLAGPDFYRPAHQVIFDCILDLYGRGEPADAITVAAELNRTDQLSKMGGAVYLHTLIQSTPTAANAGYYAAIVAEQAVLRRLVEAGTRVVQLGYGAAGGKGDVDDIVDRAQQEIYDVTEKRMSEDYSRLEDVLQPTMDELDAIASRGGTARGVPTGIRDLDELTNGLQAGQMVVIAARPGVGKALALDTPIATPTGWTTMGEVAVGDQVMGSDGRPTTVVAATEVMTGRPCYEVHFSDGSVIVADAQHQWLTETRASRRSAQQAATGYNRYRNQRTNACVRTTQDIARTVRCATKDARLNHSVTNAAPLQLPEADFPLPPYALGVWLGDGTSRAAHFTSNDPEIALHIEADGLVVEPTGVARRYSLRLPARPAVEARPCPMCGELFVPKTSQVQTCGKTCGGRLRASGGVGRRVSCPDCGGPSSGLAQCQACRDDHGTVQGLLRSLGVFGDKHIPTAYLRGSVAQRRALLAGLLDTDGTVAPSGVVQFAVTNQRLAEDARELIAGLGHRVRMTRKRVRGRSEASSTCFTLTFSTDDEVFRLERKKLVHKERGARGCTARSVRFITDVRPIESVPVRCIEVDAEDHLFLAGRSFIPTHNSTLGLDIARSATVKHHLATCIFSLEMSKHEITMRLLSAEAKVPLHHMRAGTLSDEDWSKLARRMGEIADAPLYIDDSPNMTMMEIRAKARRLKQRNDLKLVVIDYLQLMTSGKRVESRQQEVSEFSRALKLLAKELEVPVIAMSQLNRGSEQRQDKKPMLSDLRESGCLPADTRILRADTGAETTMGELFESGATDVPVWALDDNLRYVRRHLTHVFSTGRKPVLQLTSSSGKTIRATANHPFLTYDGFRPLGELAPGDRIAVPRHVPAPDRMTVWEDEKVVLLAHLIGDGSFVKRQPLRYASIDEENLRAVTTAALHFGVVAARDEYAAARCTTLRLRAPFPLTHGRRNPIAAWLDELGLFGLRSHEKFVPQPAFSLPKKQIALFLRHLWATDGSVTVNKNGRGGRVYYASTSRQLVDDVSRLLLRFGISCRVRRVGKSGYRDGWTLDISGCDDQRRFLGEIGVHGARGAAADQLLGIVRQLSGNPNVDTVPVQVWERVRAVLEEKGMSHRAFAAAMGSAFCGSTMWKRAPSRERLGRIAAVLDDAELEIQAVNDVLWDEIVAIEQGVEEEVYDATVLGGHNFVAEGIAVHNSIEQDADMVMMIHREDMYEKESPRAGEADIMLVKHRNGPTANVTVAFQGHYSRFVDMAN